MANAPETPPTAQVIEIDWSDEPPTVYSNGAQIAHSGTEFSICFTEFAPIAGRRARGDGTNPRARVVSSVRLHPEIFFQLVVAAASNWNKFVNRLPPLGPRPPKFQLVGATSFQLEGLEPADQPDGDGSRT
jgi:hypothetical protein